MQSIFLDVLGLLGVFLPLTSRSPRLLSILRSKMLVAMCRWAAAQGESARSSVEGSSFSSLLSLFGDTVRVARSDCSLLLRTSGVEEAADTLTGVGEAGGTSAMAAW